MYTNYPQVRSPKVVKTPESSSVVCTVCGSLECLCRPRFFSGQLLTEEDLNRLDRYITNKSRLHNRMLFGYGVVNGLEVKCSPCNDQVVVTPGYALSPCGDDIVVCKETAVDICALVDACTSKHERDCGPYSPPEMQDCPDIEQDWILAICYEEKTSRGITPLRNTGSQAGSSGCGCGGTSNCGCQGKPNKTTRISSGRQSAAQCEPTIICEGYRFTLFRPAEVDRANDRPMDRSMPVYGTPGVLTRYGASPAHNLEQSAWECISDLLRLANRLKEPTNLGIQDLYKWCCSLKDAFQDFLAQHGGTNCTLYDLLNSFRCPDPLPFGQEAEKYKLAIADQIGELTGTLSQYIEQCLCSAVLSPVPSAMLDNCVPLATVTLRRKDCRIIRVCNTDVRKFAITFANLSYWLSSFEPFMGQFREVLNRLCCSGNRFTQAVPINFRSRGDVQQEDSTAFDDRSNNEAASMIERFVNAWEKQDMNPDPRAPVLEALRLVKEDGSRYMNDIERDNPVQSMLFDRLIVPFIASIGEGVSRRAGEAPSVDAPDLADVRVRLDELAKTVQAQQDTISVQQELIDDLRSRPGNQ